MVNQPGKMLSLLTKADVELAAGKSRDLALEHYFSAREIAELRGFLPANSSPIRELSAHLLSMR